MGRLIDTRHRDILFFSVPRVAGRYRQHIRAGPESGLDDIECRFADGLLNTPNRPSQPVNIVPRDCQAISAHNSIESMISYCEGIRQGAITVVLDNNVKIPADKLPGGMYSTPR
jgi:hypothetical protein